MPESTTEVEFRGILSKRRYEELLNFFKKHAEDLGEDNRETVFFIIPDKTFKVTKNISKNKAKIALKVGNIKTGKQEEIEIPLDIKEVGKTINLFKALGFDELQYTSQKRHNFLYEGIEFAVKHSDDWDYHFEAEMIVSDKNQVRDAEQKIRKVCQKLNLRLLTEQEIKEMCERIDADYREKSKKSI